jgi:hypothetical protein
MLICTVHYSELTKRVAWMKSLEPWQPISKKEVTRNRRLMQQRASFEVAIDLLA